MEITSCCQGGKLKRFIFLCAHVGMCVRVGSAEIKEPQGCVKK